MPQPRQYSNAADKQKAYRQRQADRIRAVSEGRLPPPPAIGTMPAEQRWKGMQNEARRTLEALRDEMQAYYDARSDQWQESDRGSELAGKIEAVESLLDDLDNLP